MIHPRPRLRPHPAFLLLLLVPLGAGCGLQDLLLGDACARPANEIVAENCFEGHPPTEWDINGYGDPSIQGFGTEIAIAQGETIEFKVDTDSDDYRIDIYRMGYYGGMGARRVESIEPSAALPQVQPECLRGPIPVLGEGGGMETWPAPLVDCGNWGVSASWSAPEDATSGIYFARLVREDPVEGWMKNDQFEPERLPPTGRDSLWEADGFRAVMRNALREPRASHVYFVVRDDDGASDMLFQTSDLTWQAYNRYGGHSVYGRLHPEGLRLHGGEPRAPKVSYNRPFETRHYRAVNMPFNALLRRSEAVRLRWDCVEFWQDGSARVIIRRSKTSNASSILYVGHRAAEALRRIRPTDAASNDRVFGLRSGRSISNRIAAMARAAGLGDGFSGHSPRIGMAQDLTVAGVGLPALMVAGRWKSERMPAYYARAVSAGLGAVARYYAEESP